MHDTVLADTNKEGMQYLMVIYMHQREREYVVYLVHVESYG